MAGDARCDACPLARAGVAGDVPCPSTWEWPAFCGHAAREESLGLPDGSRYWSAKCLALAGQEPPARPPDFPSRDPAGGRLRLGWVTPVLYPAGAESHMMSLVRYVDPALVSWRGLAVLNGPGSREPGISAAFAERLPLADGRDAALALARSCDVLIGWDLGDLPVAMKAANPRLKIVIVSHATPDSGWGLRAMSRLEGVDLVVAVSELAIGAGDPGTRVAWNCVDVGRLEVRRTRAEMRARWGVPGDAPVAVQFGRLSSEKGPRALARAIGHLPEPWHCVVVGEGPERPEPGPRLRVVGGDPAAGDVLAAADVLVVPSDYESFGLSLGEGLWAGIPVVSTEVGIARLGPGLTRPIPAGADGPTIAGAILAAHAAGPMPGSQAWARERLSPARFGREWGELIRSLAPAPARPPTPGLAEALDLARRRRECPSGTKPPGCGCSDTLACSRTGREMTRRECYSCLEAGADPGGETTP
jgi:hypothetical protein